MLDFKILLNVYYWTILANELMNFYANVLPHKWEKLFAVCKQLMWSSALWPFLERVVPTIWSTAPRTLHPACRQEDEMTRLPEKAWLQAEKHPTFDYVLPVLCEHFKNSIHMDDISVYTPLKAFPAYLALNQKTYILGIWNVWLVMEREMVYLNNIS